MTVRFDFVVGQNETNKTWQLTLYDGYGNVVNLSAATSVMMHWINMAGTVVTNAACTIVNATGGVISYTPVAADVATAQPMQAEVEVTWNNGSTTYFPDSAGKWWVNVTAKLA